MILLVALLVVVASSAAMLSDVGPPLGLAVLAVMATMVVVNAPLPAEHLRRTRLAGLVVGVPMALLFALSAFGDDLVLTLATAPVAVALVATGLRSHLQLERGGPAPTPPRPDL